MIALNCAKLMGQSSLLSDSPRNTTNVKLLTLKMSLVPARGPSLRAFFDCAANLSYAALQLNDDLQFSHSVYGLGSGKLLFAS